ncbi:leucine-rich repeat protein [Plasmodium knowlesi strain H]|uniref:Leucine-rich repeat protein n=3 Tax=Plasmodium knowlesi TaxID=5850 RepID=A0A5K1UWD1_PLAKH|nr:leucine-rich repeat protein [Plasmodium knowlesi strain H]OTN64719.1 Leucine-rich repeat protein [Plasmodium knowlesi]CAA9989203.1 leucine-rich repeat protein [Plasmodium knowlesi strain H]SBO27285.1 leucine-rich repeat protein [Plasmodium knowlesi strain H]SBO27426.1 leucine-rich repeat protein [Plasmodium knowlesi strain H]VVS78677.1 leucine-rich repeat protein [Plasmodium knowlesi strain H]|eukprot:XP_002261548.1 hypothetical protein, conserved in Plasmodium species [Plasmodium knowlesi strain H]
MLLDLSNCNLRSLEDSDLILEKLIEQNADYTSVTYLDASNNCIRSLKGLSCFENLKILNISNNFLTSLDGDFIPPCTEKIIAHHNDLTDICFKGVKKLSAGTEEKEVQRYSYHGGMIKSEGKPKCDVNTACFSFPEEKGEKSPSSSYNDTYRNNLLNEKVFYTNRDLPLNRLAFLDVSFNKIKKLTTFERYLHIINRRNQERSFEGGFSDEGHINDFITNKTEQDVMLLFFNSLDTLYLRGNKLTNLKGLSVFKNLKVLDLRSNLINHPVQLFYLLDNKNWLKQYNEKNMSREEDSFSSSPSSSNGCYSYFLSVLQKYRNLKCLQNVFLRGNQHVLKPKHLFLSVCDVLRCANTRGRFTTDVALGEEREEGEEVDGVGEETVAVREVVDEVREEDNLGDEPEGEKNLVDDLLSASSQTEKTASEEGYPDEGYVRDDYTEMGYSEGGDAVQVYLDESLIEEKRVGISPSDRMKEPAGQVKKLIKTVEANLTSNKRGDRNPPMRHQTREEQNAREKVSEPNILAERSVLPNGADDLEETSAYRYLREERNDKATDDEATDDEATDDEATDDEATDDEATDDEAKDNEEASEEVCHDAVPSGEIREDFVPTKKHIEKLINTINRHVSTNASKMVTPINGRINDDVVERCLRENEGSMVQTSEGKFINAVGKIQGVKASSAEGENGSTYEGVVRQEGISDYSCEEVETEESDEGEMETEEDAESEEHVAPPNGLIHLVRDHSGSGSAVNVEEEETSCTSSIVDGNHAKKVLKEILSSSEGLERYSSNNSSSMGSDVFEGDSDEENTEGEESTREDVAQGEITQMNKCSASGVSTDPVSVPPNKGRHLDRALTGRMVSEHKRGEDNGGDALNAGFCRNSLIRRGIRAEKTKRTEEPNGEKAKSLIKNKTLNDEVHVDNVRRASCWKNAKEECLDGRRKSMNGDNHSLVTKVVPRKIINVEDSTREKSTLKKENEKQCASATSGTVKEEKSISKEGEGNEKNLHNREIQEEKKKALMELLKLDLCKSEKWKKRGGVDKSNDPCVYKSKDKKCRDYSASVKSESTDVTERDSHKHILKADEKLRMNFPYDNGLGELHRSRGISVYAYPIRIQGGAIDGGGKAEENGKGRGHDKESNNDERNYKESSTDKLNNQREKSQEDTLPSSRAEILKRMNDLQASNEKDATLSNSLALHLKEVCLTLGKEKQQSDILLDQNDKFQKEIMQLKESKKKLKAKIKKLENCYKQKCRVVKRYQHMRERFKLAEQEQVDIPEDDIDHQNKYIENTMEQIYNVFSDVFGESHVMTKRIENLANVYIKKEKSVEIQMVTQRKQLELLKNVEEIVKKKNEYHCELQKKNEIITSLNSNLAKITQSVADMKNGVLENEKKMKDLTMQLAKKDALLKEFERKNNQMMDEKEKMFQKERAQLLDLLNDKGENVKSVKQYKEEIKCLENKLKNYLDRNVHKIHDKNYELMVDKLHDEQIKMHSLLTEKEKIINEKNIQIENLESQLQSWADEATNWVVVADKHTKLITNHNILKKNYEELKYKYIMDMKYIQTNKNEKVKELIRKYA